MTTALVIAALAVAFPKDGARLPCIDRCYMIGSVDQGVSAVNVQCHDVPVHPLGGWVTMVLLHPGTNTVYVGATNLTLVVATPPAPVAVVTGKVVKAVQPKVYTKLEYAADEPATNVSKVIYIDPGHGGPKDTGALSPHGYAEKDFNLRMSMAVRTALTNLGYTVHLSRTNDVPVELYDRPKAAHLEKAAAFVSIHHNAPPYDKDPRELRYHAVFCWNPIGESLAKAINASMASELGESLKNNGVMHANFAVTRSSEIPSCLIEVDFISTPEGEQACWNPARTRRIAASIAGGIDSWYRSGR